MVGVVLLTDGRQNAPGDPSPLVDRLAARGIPIYPVLVGSTTPPPDDAVASIKAPEGVNKGDVADVSASIKLDGLEPDTGVEVTLDPPGAEPLRQTVRVPADRLEADRDVPRPARRRRLDPADGLGRARSPTTPGPTTTRRPWSSGWPTTRPASCSSTARPAGSSSTSATPWSATRG